MKLALAALAAAVVAAPAAPVIRYPQKQFGPILATPKKQALYYWAVEKRDHGRIHCTGACAKLWPPLLVKAGASVPARLRGVKGSFGTVKRPDGRTQVTFRGLALYTYVHEGPTQVLCNNVNGWFVVRV
jgi:predicted lipoprotein with Yx(FWY)xxD motif